MDSWSQYIQSAPFGGEIDGLQEGEKCEANGCDNEPQAFMG